MITCKRINFCRFGTYVLHGWIMMMILGFSTPTSADTLDGFIKIWCNAKTKSGMISVYYAKAKEGSVSTGGEGTIVFPMSSEVGTTKTTIAACSLAYGKTLHFVSVQGSLPKDNSVGVFIGNTEVFLVNENSENFDVKVKLFDKVHSYVSYCHSKMDIKSFNLIKNCEKTYKITIY